MIRHYIAMVEEQPGKAVGVWLPDLPACTSAGDTLDEALLNAREAIDLWFDDNDARPVPRTLAQLRDDPKVAEDLRAYRLLVAAIPVELPDIVKVA
ncbi:MAG: type II toxin-antitoxin system HicB family antitoxin [Bosea sp. (in: a-proteobacteria)]